MAQEGEKEKKMKLSSKHLFVGAFMLLLVVIYGFIVPKDSRSLLNLVMLLVGIAGMGSWIIGCALKSEGK